MSTANTPSAARPAVTALVVVLLGLTASACKQADAVEQDHYKASKITPAEDGSDHPVVTITKLGAEQIELKTTPVAKNGKGSRIPYTAVLYDGADGQSFVYVNIKGLSFQRENITIDNIVGDTVDISSGPAVGTRVVTAGVPQIHGAELEFGSY